jgi:hypothetical protein
MPLAAGTIGGRTDPSAHGAIAAGDAQVVTQSSVFELKERGVKRPLDRTRGAQS